VRAEIDTFFTAVRESGYESVTDFTEIIRILKAQRAEVHQLKESIREERRRYTRARTAVKRIQAELVASEAVIEEGRRQSEIGAKEKVELADRIRIVGEEKQNAIAALQNQIHELSASVAQHIGRRRELKKEVSTLKQQLAAAECEVSKSNAEMHEAVQNSVALQLDISGKDAKLSELEHQFEQREGYFCSQIAALEHELRRSKGESDGAAALFRAELSAANDRAAEKATVLEKAEEQLSHLKENVRELEETVAGKTREIDSLQTEQAKLNRICKLLREQRATTEQELAKVAREVNREQHSVAKLRARSERQLQDVEEQKQIELDRAAKDCQDLVDAQAREHCRIEDSLRASLADQAQEIRNLQTIIRKLSVNLEREEADSARLRAQFQLTKTRCDRK
jgi:chromosome segregation ATPase